MNDKILKVLGESAVEYFVGATGEKAYADAPYVKGIDELILLDYTGLIGISGSNRGAIYITCSKQMLTEITSIILSNDLEGVDIADMVGEIANTVSGNAQKALGGGFMISVPVIVKGRFDHFKFQIRPPTYVIPIVWREHKSYLVIGIEPSTQK